MALPNDREVRDDSDQTLSGLDGDFERGTDTSSVQLRQSSHSQGMSPPPWMRNRSKPQQAQGERDLEKSTAERVDEVCVTAKGRIRHFTWTWFTMTMATGGIANVIHAVPFRFHGLYTIGVIFFILDIVLFVFTVVMISLRFYFFPGTFKGSLTHPTESLFVPASVISLGTVIINTAQYGLSPGKTGTWLVTTMIVLFWSYSAFSVLCSCGMYLLMWSTQTFTISQMTPIWIFPAYPLLIVGPFAGNLLSSVKGLHALQIIVGGFVVQGIGFMVSLMIYAAFLYRLMTEKLPQESMRPGMFVSVGPSGFTITALVNMASYLPQVIPLNWMDGNGQLAGHVSLIMANWAALWLWGLAWWFFIVSLGAHISCLPSNGHRLHFSMTWYSFIFPNTALITGTFAIASSTCLNNKTIQIIGCVLTCILIGVWLAVFGMMIRAVWVKQILWPQNQEDRDEGGWTSGRNRHATPQEKELDRPARSAACGWASLSKNKRRASPGPGQGEKIVNEEDEQNARISPHNSLDYIRSHGSPSARVPPQLERVAEDGVQ